MAVTETVDAWIDAVRTEDPAKGLLAARGRLRLARRSPERDVHRAVGRKNAWRIVSLVEEVIAATEANGDLPAQIGNVGSQAGPTTT